MVNNDDDSNSTSLELFHELERARERHSVVNQEAARLKKVVQSVADQEAVSVSRAVAKLDPMLVVPSPSSPRSRRQLVTIEEYREWVKVLSHIEHITAGGAKARRDLRAAARRSRPRGATGRTNATIRLAEMRLPEQQPWIDDHKPSRRRRDPCGDYNGRRTPPPPPTPPPCGCHEDSGGVISCTVQEDPYIRGATRVSCVCQAPLEPTCIVS